MCVFLQWFASLFGTPKTGTYKNSFPRSALRSHFAHANRFETTRNNMATDVPFFGHVPVEQRTPKLCHEFVSKGGTLLKYVPLHLRTRELCWTAVRESPCAIEHVPWPHCTEAMCFAAVKCRGWTIQHVPLHRRTQELCLAAVTQNGYALKYIPFVEQTPQLYQAAVQTSGQVLKYVPDCHRTEKVCWAAVQQSAWALAFVPEHVQTEALCLMAVRQQPAAINYVSAQCMSLDIVRMSLRGYAFDKSIKAHLTSGLIKEDFEDLLCLHRHLFDQWRQEQLCDVRSRLSMLAMLLAQRNICTEVAHLLATFTHEQKAFSWLQNDRFLTRTRFPSNSSNISAYILI